MISDPSTAHGWEKFGKIQWNHRWKFTAGQKTRVWPHWENTTSMKPSDPPCHAYIALWQGLLSDPETDQAFVGQK